MTMKGFVCWSPREVHPVINPDAEAVLDHVFAAVHTTYDLLVAQPADRPPVRMPPADVVTRFLEPSLDYVQAVVLGESGSGKSHFIQWLRLNLPRQADTHIFTIHKAGTSLKGILQRIVNELPEVERADYQEKLNSAGQYALSQEGRFNRLLDQLALAIGEEQQPADELEQALIEGLPSLFRDPYLRREHFLRSGQIVEELVNHIFSDPHQYRPLEERRLFTAADLPMGGLDYQKAANLTRDVIDILQGEPGAMESALRIINRNLDAAIAQTLSFSADGLIELMNTLRRHLYHQGRRLILLIEDFARLQGIDIALLQALITPPSQGEERLCELRWAMAVTTGYYKQLPETVRTRTTFSVHMDLPGTQDGLVGSRGLARFASRYLNAVRLGEARLQANHERQAETADACSPCSYREECHSSFGAEDGFGFYPFTVRALWEMANRADEQLVERFNPRRFLQAVLKPVLIEHANDLREGAFPSPVLLAGLNRKEHLTPRQKQELRQRDPLHCDRRWTLLELWDGKGRIVNLDPGIHAAFGLPELADTETQADAKTDNEQVELRDVTDTVSVPVLDPRIAVLFEWGRGASLRENVANELRDLLFNALDSHLDWDALGLERTAFAAATGSKSFRRVSIVFPRQSTQETPSRVRLQIPADPDNAQEWERTLVALEGLINYSQHRHWDFPGGRDGLFNLLNCLEIWSARVATQLKGLQRAGKDWNPLSAAVELLAVGVALAGRLKATDTTSTAVYAALWGQAPPEMRFYSGELQKLYDAISKQWESLQAVVRALSSGTKGGQSGNFIQPVPLLDALDRLRARAWRLELQSPEDSEAGTPQFAEIARLYRRCAQIDQAAEAEKGERLAWLARLEKKAPGDKGLEELKDVLKGVVNALLGAGLKSTHRARLQQTLDSFSTTGLSRLITGMRPLKEGPVQRQLFRLNGSMELMGAVDQFLALAEQFLADAEANLNLKRKDLADKGGLQLQACQQRIEAALSSLERQLTVLAGLSGGNHESD